MDLRRLTYFVAVAEERNFTRAAQRLHISQPPLSQQIAKLERELGAKLLERNSRHVRLTPAGQVLLSEARGILDRAEEASKLVERAADGAATPVRIGSVSSAFSGVLLRTLREVRQRFPDVRPLVYEMEATDQRRALARNDIDLGFMRSIYSTSAISLAPIAAERYLAVLHTEHALASSGPVGLQDLRGEPFVFFPRASSPDAFDNVMTACASLGFSPKILYEVSNDHALLAIVAAGLAVSIVPESTSNLHLPGIVYVQLEGDVPASTLSVAISTGDHNPIADLIADTAIRIHSTECAEPRRVGRGPGI